ARPSRAPARKAGPAQAEISGYLHALKATASGGKDGWPVTASIDGAEIATDFEVLVWSDIVRGSMEAGIWGTYIQLAQTAWIYIASGALRRLTWLRKGPVIAALYPVALLLVQFVIALIAVGLGAWALGAIHPWLSPLGICLLPAVLFWFKRQDRRFYAYYLMHDYAYSARHGGAAPPELEQRMADFGDMIAQALSEDIDEVLVVGHSSGAHLGVSILADLLRSGRVRPNGPALGFLTLGQVVPMVSFLPGAHRLRADLRYLSAQAGLTWIDVTAPGDGCSFALCDPVAVSGVAPDDQKWPIIFSAAFTQSLSPERWEELKRKYFRLHFQYLCAFDRPRDYDYFQITAGPLTLARRYGTRASSKSRIDVPASKFTSVAA
ncbi:MAG: hypothetical protein AAF647_09165, partial [Pseudomonadota bacterium]